MAKVKSVDFYEDAKRVFENLNNKKVKTIQEHDAELLDRIGEYLFNSKYASEKIADLDYDQTVTFSRLEWYQILEEMKEEVNE